jgi:tetratricopeptide (TPR) repeat protein
LCEADLWDEAAEHLESLKRLQWVTEDEEPVWRAGILLGQGRNEEALSAAGDRAEELPHLARTAAIAHARLGHADEARRLLTASAAEKGHGAALGRGHVYAALGDYEEALRWYEKDMASPVCAARAARAAGEMLLALGDHGEARAAFARAIRCRPFLHPDDLRGLAASLRAMGRNSDADRWNRLAREQDEPPGEEPGAGPVEPTHAVVTEAPIAPAPPQPPATATPPESTTRPAA